MALDKSYLISLFIESVFWGLLTPTYFITIFLLLRKPSEVIRNIPYLIIGILVFVLCTAHVILSFTRTSNAFVGEPLHPDALLRNMSDILYRAKYGVLFVTVFIGDFVIVSRCFRIWNKNILVVVVPILTAIATLVFASGALHAMINIAGNGETSNSAVRAWTIATYTAALATKLICAALIMFRVQQIHAELTRNINRHVKIYTGLLVLTESGSLAFLLALILLPLTIAGIDEHAIFCDLLSPVTGITIMLITAGTSIDLSAAQGPGIPHTVWRQSSPPNRQTGIQRPVVPTTSRWDDFDDMKGVPSSETPTSSGHNFEDVNKSNGTLNLGIVI